MGSFLGEVDCLMTWLSLMDVPQPILSIKM